MANMDKNNEQLVEELLNCPICFEKYVSPQVLPCQHCFCEKCVKKMKRGNSIECPMDRETCNFKSVKPDFRQVQFMEAIIYLQEEKLKTIELLAHYNGDWDGDLNRIYREYSY